MTLLSGRRFAPSLFATLLALVGIASTVNLGMWQLRRADEKRDIVAQIESGASQTVPLRTKADALPRYQMITATGRYDAARQVLLDNMPSLRGMPGYRVLTPFELEGGGWVLVDRGWIPMGPTRATLPPLEVSEAPRTIIGRIDAVPTPGIRLAAKAMETTLQWPLVMNFPEHADLERALDRPLASFIVRLDATQSDGFERSAPVRADFGPNRHIAYAVQWFGFAIAMFVIYVLLSLKPRSASTPNDRTDA